MLKLIEVAARVLAPQFKIDIVETHHLKKLDRPSGTANKMLDIILAQSGWKMDRDVFFYEEACPAPLGQKPVSVCSVRKGEIIGDHTIHFTSPGESIEITHHAFNRAIFAQGALAAARWVVDKPAGLYTMADVLELTA
jgi:4-hydroxy-tetrahydrodipicolinate reductase